MVFEKYNTAVFFDGKHSLCLCVPSSLNPWEFGWQPAVTVCFIGRELCVDCFGEGTQWEHYWDSGRLSTSVPPPSVTQNFLKKKKKNTATLPAGYPAGPRCQGPRITLHSADATCSKTAGEGRTDITHTNCVTRGPWIPYTCTVVSAIIRDAYLRDIHNGIAAERPGWSQVVGAQERGDNPVLIHLADHSAVHEVDQVELINGDAWFEEQKVTRSERETELKTVERCPFSFNPCCLAATEG